MFVFVLVGVKVVVRVACVGIEGYMNHSGKYIEINFNMKIPYYNRI